MEKDSTQNLSTKNRDENQDHQEKENQQLRQDKKQTQEQRQIVRTQDTEADELAKKVDEIDIVDKKGSEKDEEGGEQNDEQAQQQQQYFTRDFVDVNRTIVNFNRATLFPGSIDEVEVIINLKQEALDYEIPKSNLPLKVVALCNEQKFNELDQYVFSVRDNDRFQYFQEVTPVLNKTNKVCVKVAVKMPAVKEPQIVEGTLSLQLINLTPIYFPIIAKCQIPNIACLKQLYDVQQGVGLIKIPAKKNVRMPPLPFKNLSAFNFLLQAETASTEDFTQRAYDINVSSVVNCSANSPFFVNMQLKSNLKYSGTPPKTDTLRKILILKVKNSTVCFSYPLQVFVFESSSGSSMS